MKNRSSSSDLSKALGISPARGAEALMKAQMISAILKSAQEKGLTHSRISDISGLPRSAVTGILSGSLQKVTIDRLLRLLEAVGLEAHLRIIKAS